MPKRTDRQLIQYRLNQNIKEQEDQIRRLEEIAGILNNLEHQFPGRYTKIIASLHGVARAHVLIKDTYETFISEHGM